MSDGPDPTKSNVVLQLWDSVKDKTTKPKVSEVPPLGHQDPAWRPDGKVLYYVRNAREGAKGAPAIYRWDMAKKAFSAVTGPGYLEPSLSPDGKYIAATKINAFGTDVVILDASRGRELLRVTNDGTSWAPVWSPGGDGIAFLHMEGQIVDLRLAPLEGDAPGWTIGEITDLTTVSGLDGSSRPDWFIPADQLPETPAPTVPASPSPGSSERASPSP
jgi:Tol biopolymer transport system component